MDKLVSRGKGNVGKIMDRVLERYYSGKARNVTFVELLNCDALPTFLKIYSKFLRFYFEFSIVYNSTGNGVNTSKFKLSEKFTKLCISAKSALDHVYTSIETGSITLMQLSQLKANGYHVNELLIEVKTSSLMKKFKLSLKRRYYEQSLFAERLGRLRKVCENISISIEGIGEHVPHYRYIHIPR